jgi:PAS domain S-box-containing protein
MKTRSASIQQKLMRAILLTCGLTLLFVLVSYITYQFFTFRQTILNQLTTEAKIIAANSTAAIAFESEGDAAEILAALKAEKNVVAACLFDNEGHLFATYSIPSFTGSFPAVQQKEGYSFRKNYLEIFAPVLQRDTRLGTLYIKLNMAPVYSHIEWYSFIVILFGGLTFLLAFYLSKRLQKNISTPILELAEKSKIVSEKYDYSVRAVKMSNDELGVLTDAFNHMLTQIEIQNRQIAVFNRELEQKVEERTAQLNKSNEELKRQNEFVQTILDASMDIMAVYDKDMRVISFNKAAQNLFRLKKEDVLGKKYGEIFPNAINSPFVTHLNNALQGAFIHIEKFKSPITGRYLENFFVPLRDNNNQVYAVFAAGHDITEIVQATEQLKTINAALAKSNTDLEQFAYVASHDLQEPLRKIQVYAQVIEKNNIADASFQNYFGKIKNAAQRMTELIRAVLEYSRLSKNDEQFKLIDLNEVLENVKNDFELLIAEKQATIKADKLPRIHGNPLQINQLFSNLLNNALKFSLNHPFIQISCETIAAAKVPCDGIKVTPEFFELKFTDDGIGFDTKNAERIFSIFQRLHTREEFSGTGIGLALCKKIAENHNGFITAFGQPGKGATFIVYLPNENLQ